MPIEVVSTGLIDIPTENSPSLEPASKDDIARFGELMAAEPPQPVEAAQAAEPSRSSGKATLGDEILEKMNRVGEAYRKDVDTIHASLKGAQDKPFTITEILQLQLQMSEHSVAIEVIGKGVSKTTEHVTKLTSLQ